MKSGGNQPFALDAGPSFAGSIYVFLIGSLAGKSPGIVIQPNRVLLPLNFEFLYFAFTLGNPNTPPLSSSLGILDAAGSAKASFDLPAGSPANLAALTFDHAYAMLGPLGTAVFSSNTVPLVLGP